MVDDVSYLDLLARLTASKPLLADALVSAERRRVERLAAYLDGARFSGLEQLYTYLDAAAASYAEIPAISGLRFLMERVRADYQTALEATLSGYQSVTADAMRDVMEIEALLLDFAANRDHIEEWLKSDHKLRIRKYGPDAVRKRLKNAGIPPYGSDGFEPIDYRAHSEALHVNPGFTLPGRGPDPSQDPVPFYADLGFVEMFEHGDRILMAIELLRVVMMGAPTDYTPLAPRDKFDDAHVRTHQMQVVMVGFLQGPERLREQLGREPTAAELLGHVKNEIAAKG